MVGKGLRAARATHTQRLVRIAEHASRLTPHAGLLPDDSTTLFKLCSLTDERFRKLLGNGTIHPNMGRNDMAVPGPVRCRWGAISSSLALGSHPVRDRSWPAPRAAWAGLRWCRMCKSDGCEASAQCLLVWPWAPTRAPCTCVCSWMTWFATRC